MLVMFISRRWSLTPRNDSVDRCRRPVRRGGKNLWPCDDAKKIFFDAGCQIPTSPLSLPFQLTGVCWAVRWCYVMLNLSQFRLLSTPQYEGIDDLSNVQFCCMRCNGYFVPGTTLSCNSAARIKASHVPFQIERKKLLCCLRRQTEVFSHCYRRRSQVIRRLWVWRWIQQCTSLRRHFLLKKRYVFSILLLWLRWMICALAAPTLSDFCWIEMKSKAQASADSVAQLAFSKITGRMSSLDSILSEVQSLLRDPDSMMCGA